MTATSAAKAGKFGKLTRRVELWIPERLLCKRFHVKVPKIVDYAEGPDLPTNVFDQSTGGAAELPQLTQASPKKLTVGQLDMSEESSKVEQVAKLLASEETYDPSQDEKMGNYKEPQKPAPSLFSAIFEENDDDTDDEDSEVDDVSRSTSEQANPKIIPTPTVKEIT